MNDVVKKSQPQSRLDLFDDFDNLFGNLFRPSRFINEPRAGTQTPAIDLIEKDDAYELRAELPGVEKEDLDISIKDGVLTINAQTKNEHREEKDGRLIRQERYLGKYVRSLRLGSNIDETKIDANYVDGILSVMIPKPEEVKPQKIDVKY